MILTASPCVAQEHLWPQAAEDGFLDGYQAMVREVLKDAYAPEVRARVLVYPAFHPEYAIGLKQTPQGHAIFLIEPARQIWSYTLIELMRQGRVGVMSLDGKDGSAEAIAELRAGLPENPSDLPLTRCSVEVNPEIASAVQDAWAVMLTQLRPGEQDGTDGVSYRFSMEANGRSLAGATWSPSRGSRTAKLVKLVDSMRDFCVTQQPGRAEEVLMLARRLLPPSRHRPRL